MEEEINLGGRPPKFTDPEELERLVDDYFEWIQGEYDHEKQQVTRRAEPPTVNGLALHLGFCSKTSVYDYQKKPGFMYPIKKALTLIEKYHEIETAQGDKCTGNIFILKNFGWKDTQNHTHDLEKPSVLAFDPFENEVKTDNGPEEDRGDKE